MSFAAINYLAVIVATIVAFLIGAVWYSFLFRAQWMAATGVTGNPAMPLPRLLAINAVGNLILALILSALLHSLGSASFGGGVSVGLFVWLGFVITALAVNNSFANRPPALTLIDGGHWLVVLVVGGAIIGLFG